jgi:hypothetical protein
MFDLSITPIQKYAQTVRTAIRALHVEHEVHFPEFSLKGVSVCAIDPVMTIKMIPKIPPDRLTPAARRWLAIPQT